MRTFREYAIDAIKLAGQELIDRAEELVPATKNVKDMDIWIRIPSLDDRLDPVEIQVNTTVYPDPIKLHRVYDKFFENVD